MKYLMVLSNDDHESFELIKIDNLYISDVISKFDLSQQCSIIDIDDKESEYTMVRDGDYNVVMTFENINEFVSIAWIFKKVIGD